MSTTPVITIFVRHSADCKYKGDETSKRCDCRKHLRWTQNGLQYRKKANTRSWKEAERVKRELEDELAGTHVPAAQPSQPSSPLPSATTLEKASRLFIDDKRLHVSDDVVKKYTRLLDRLRTHCEEEEVFTVQGLTPEVISQFCKN